MQTTPIILGRRLSIATALLIAGLVLGGCAHSPHSGVAGGGSSPRSKSKASRELLNGKPISPEEERRAEAHAQFGAGLIADLRDEDKLALEHYERAVQSDPSQDGLALDVARRHLVNKDSEKAITVLREAIGAGGSGVLSAFLASIYASLGRNAEAIDSNLEAIKRSPSLLIGHQNLSQLYLKEGKPEESLKVLERAGELKNASAQYLVELAELWIGQPQPKPETKALVRKRATELLDRVMLMTDNPAMVQQRAADAYMLVGQNAKAIDLYLKLVEKYPQATPLRERLADLFLQSRDSKRAIEQMEALIKEEPSRYPQAYLILGSLALQDNKFKEAEDYLRKAVVLTPTFEPAYYDLAIAQVNSGNVRAGLETLDDARRRFSETFQTEFLSGLALARMKDYSNAVRRFTTAEIIARTRETNRLTHFFYFQLGSAHERNQNYEESEKHFRKAIEIMPDFAEALNYLGYMWVEKGIKLDEAKKLIDRAVRLEPKNGAFLDSQAWLLYKQGKPKEALGPMLKAIENTPEPDPTLFDHLGDIYQALGDVRRAMESWRKSLKIEPNPEIQKKLDASEAAPGK
jgi:tetratricopeptide (TPR) repeat protein